MIKTLGNFLYWCMHYKYLVWYVLQLMYNLITVTFCPESRIINGKLLFIFWNILSILVGDAVMDTDGTRTGQVA